MKLLCLVLFISVAVYTAFYLSNCKFGYAKNFKYDIENYRDIYISGTIKLRYRDFIHHFGLNPDSYNLRFFCPIRYINKYGSDGSGNGILIKFNLIDRIMYHFFYLKLNIDMSVEGFKTDREFCISEYYDLVQTDIDRMKYRNKE